MDSRLVREKYLKFFEERGHKRIPPSPLVLENDPTTLFTSSGMQQLVPFLMGTPHKDGKKLVDSQPSIRAQGKLDDVLEVGDSRHLTLFEMLGNWSLGDYFKDKQLPWIWEFLTKELGIPEDRLQVAVFEGTKEVPKDTESFEIWKKLGVPEEKIHFYGVKKNWWSRSGSPEEMPAGEIGGPSSEVFYDAGLDLNLHENSIYKDQKCHINCDCGRFLEIANSVFIQYVKQEDGTLTELPQRNVDFGGGLERMTTATIGEADSFKTDLFWPLIKEIEAFTGQKYDENENKHAMRVIADHIKAATFLIVNSVAPSNKLHGYLLRRLLRRAAVKMRFLNSTLSPAPIFQSISEKVLEMYDGIYFQKDSVRENVFKTIEEELVKFGKSLDRGLKIIQGLKEVTPQDAFDLYQSHGFPLEITEELLKEKGHKIDHALFNKEFEKHRELSRQGGSKMFKESLGTHN